MPQSQAMQTYTGGGVIPLYKPEIAVNLPVNLAPSTTFLQGTVLGLAGVAADDVQTISDTPTITAGTFTISGTNPITGASFTTAAIAYNASNATLKAALEAALGAGITVTIGGGTLPGTDTTVTFGGSAASMPVALMTVDNTGLTGGTLAIAKTTTGRTANTYAAYANAGSTDPAKCILQYGCTTDASGRVSFAAQAGGTQFGDAVSRTAPAWFHGIFSTADLVGLDAGAVTDLAGKLDAGSVSSGVVSF